MSVGEGTRAGPYLLLDHLGGGGQGDVFKAQNTETGQAVALKRIWLGRDPEQAARMRRLVQRKVSILLGFYDSHVVQVHDWGECPNERTSRDPLGFIYVTYELVPGATTLRKLLRAGPVGLTHMSQMFSRLGTSVSRLHERAIAHRDIKPENIMLRDGNASVPVMIDFGSMKADGLITLTGAGYGHGTVGYMGPEMSRNPREANIFLADQWSLARSFCEAVAVTLGEQARELELLDGKDVIAAVRRHLPHTSEVFTTALAPEPKQRFASVAAFIEAANKGLEKDGHASGREADVNGSWVPAWLQHTVDGMRAVLDSWSPSRRPPQAAPAEFEAMKDYATGEYPIAQPLSRPCRPSDEPRT